MKAQKRVLKEYITTFPYFKKLFKKLYLNIILYVCVLEIYTSGEVRLFMFLSLSLSLDADLFPNEL